MLLAAMSDDDIDLSLYISKEEQAGLIADQNKRKSRKKRPGQLPPPANKRNRGRPRAHTQDDDHCFDDDDTEYPEQGQTRQAKGQEWRNRLAKEQQAWQAALPANTQMAQQYAAYDHDCSVQVQVDAALHCATQSMAGALVRHSCCAVVLSQEEREQLAQQLAVQLLDTAQHRQDDQQQQQQQAELASQQQQQQQQQGQHDRQPTAQQQQHAQPQPQPQPQHKAQLLTVTAMQLVAGHTLGASFWLPVPEVHCSCCSSTWMLQPAAAGFFGCSPVRPGVWFSQQLLDTYTALYGQGTSATSFAEAVSRTSVTVDSYAPPLEQLAKNLLPIDSRQVLHAWLGR